MAIITFAAPLFAWLGRIILLFLFIQVALGIAMAGYQKPVLKWHKPLGFIILGLMILHVILGILFMNGTII